MNVKDILSMAGLIPLALAATACDDPVTPEQPTAEPWSYPSFDGDGLPASEDLAHQTYDSEDVVDGPTPTPGPIAVPPAQSLNVVDGLFALTSDEGDGFGPSLVLGNMALTTQTLACYDLYGSVDTGASADGLYLTIIPSQDKDGPLWEDTYLPCTDGPPCFGGYGVNAGQTQDLGEGAWLSIEAFGPHYLTVSWQSTVSEGEALTFYNCGPVTNWAY